MVHSVDDVIETEPDELQRSLMPARIESDDPRVAEELERASQRGSAAVAGCAGVFWAQFARRGHEFMLACQSPLGFS